MSDLMKRAEYLDNLRSKGIAEKLTLEEAEKIVHIWGIFLEYSGGIRFLLGSDIPESFLPYPIAILQGAINKMEAHYYDLDMHDRVKLLETTEAILIQFTDDKEAINEQIKRFSNKAWRDAFIPALKKQQENQVQAGFIVEKSLWKISKERLEELMK